MNGNVSGGNGLELQSVVIKHNRMLIKEVSFELELICRILKTSTMIPACNESRGSPGHRSGQWQ